MSYLRSHLKWLTDSNSSSAWSFYGPFIYYVNIFLEFFWPPPPPTSVYVIDEALPTVKNIEYVEERNLKYFFRMSEFDLWSNSQSKKESHLHISKCFNKRTAYLSKIEWGQGKEVVPN